MTTNKFGIHPNCSFNFGMIATNFHLKWPHLPKPLSWPPNPKLSTSFVRYLLNIKVCCIVRDIFWLYFRLVKMARQKNLQYMFIVIDKEEMQNYVEWVEFLWIRQFFTEYIFYLGALSQEFSKKLGF